VSIPAFVVGAGGYLGLLLAESRERVGRWGRSMRYSTTRADWHAPADTSPLAATGRRVGAAVLGIAIVVPVILPGVSTGLLGGSGSGVGGRGGSGKQNVAAINPIIDLGKDLNRGDNKTVLRYRGEPAYLRLVVLDDFDGRTWKPTPIAPKKRQDVERGIPLPPGLSDPNPTTSSYRFEILNLEEQWLPLPYPASKVTGIGGTWLYDENTRNIFSTDTSTQKRKYNATVYNVDVSAETLASADPTQVPEGVSSRDLALVPLPPAIETLALQVTQGAKTDYAKAVALQKWFRDPLQFSYSTKAPGGQTADSIASFLEKRSGYCVHFASAMALMARYLKIPARVAVGFTPGQRDSSGRYVVRLHDAHAWPELYFEGTGWVAFEPTPGQRTGSEPDYTRDSSSTNGGPNNPTQNPTPGAGGASEDSKQRQLTRVDQGAEQRRNPNPAVITQTSTPFPWIPVSLATIVAVGLVAPFLTRTVVRRRRFSHVGSPAAAAAAAWAELQDLLADHGYAWRESETPRRGAERLIRDIRLEGPAEAGLRRIARAVERVRYAPEPGQLEDLRADLKDVSRGLLVATTTWGKVKARVFPRSTRRTFGYVGERIADVLDGIDRGLAAVRSRVLPRRAF
jgi:transglutaminase-like putative cysteine protease